MILLALLCALLLSATTGTLSSYSAHADYSISIVPNTEKLQ